MNSTLVLRAATFVVGVVMECMNRATDIRKGLEYMLATGNLQSKSGLGLMQVSVLLFSD